VIVFLQLPRSFPAESLVSLTSPCAWAGNRRMQNLPVRSAWHEHMCRYKQVACMR
jgi:hypothetical protein